MLSKLLGKIIGKKNTKKLKKTVQKTVKKVEKTAKNIFSGGSSNNSKVTPIKRTTTNNVAKPKASDLVTRKKVDSGRSTTNSTPLYSPKKDYTSNIKKPNYSPKEEILKNIQNKSKNKDKVVPVKKSKNNFNVKNYLIDIAESMPGYGTAISVAKRGIEKAKTGEKLTPSDVLLSGNILSQTNDRIRKSNEKKLNNVKDNNITTKLKQQKQDLNNQLLIARQKNSKDYTKILKKYNKVSDELQTEQAKLLKKSKGLEGALEKEASVLSSGFDSSVRGFDSTIDRLVGVKSNKRKGASQILGEKAYQDTNSKIGRTALEVTESIGAMIPTIIAGIASGGTATAVSFGTYGGSAYNKAKQDGYTDKQATAYGVVNGGLEAMLNKVLPSFKVGGKNIYGKVATEKISSNIMKKVVSNNVLRSVVTDRLGEFTEEYLQEFLDPIVREAILEEDNGVGIKNKKDLVDISKSIAKYTAHNFFSKENLHAGLLGFLTSSILGMPSDISAVRNQGNFKRYANAEQTIEDEQAISEVVAKQITKNNSPLRSLNVNESETLKEYANTKQTIEENNKQIEEKKTQATLLNNNLKNKTNTTQNVAETQAQIDTLVNEIQQLKNTNAQINQEIQSNPQFRQIEALNLTLPEIQQLASGNLDINEKLQQVKEMQPYTAENPAITIPKQKGTRNYKIQETLYQIEQNMTPELLSQKLNIEEIENTSYDPLDRLANLYISAKQNLNNSVDTNGIVTMLAKIAEDKGYNIIFNSNLATNQNGRIVTKNGVKTIELNPNSVRSTEFILMHELTHAVGTKEIWQDIIDYAKADSKVAKILNNKIKAYQGQTDYTDEEIQEEVMCDMMGELLGSQEYINHLSQEKPTLFEKILKWLNDFLGRTDKSSYEHEYLSKIKADFESAYNSVDNELTGETKYSKKLNGFYPEIETKTSNINKFGISDINNLTEVQDKIYDYYKKKYVSTENQSKPITNIDTGMKIEIWKKGIYETFGNQKYYKHLSQQEKLMKLATMDNLAKMIKYGEIRSKSALNYHNPNSTAEYHYLEHPIIIDGIKYMVNIDIRKVPNVTGRFYIHSIDTKKIGASKGRKTSRLTAPISKTNIPQNEQKVNSGISNNSNMQNKEKNAVKNSIELENNTNLEYNNSGIERKFNTIEEAIEDDPRKQTYSKYNTSIDFFNLEYEEMSKAIALGSKYALEAQRLGFNSYSFNDNKYIYDFDVLNKENNAFGITNVEIIKNISEEVYNERSFREDSRLSEEQHRLQKERNNYDNKSIGDRGTSKTTSELDKKSRTNELVSNEKTSIKNSKELDSSFSNTTKYSIEPTMNDATTMDSKSLKALTKNMKQQLGLNRVQVNELEQIIQKHSKSGELNKDSIYKDIKDRFSKQSIESDIQEVKDVQRLIRDTKIDVSQNIKNDIADYNKLKQRNFGKIKFSSDGQPVDVVYQELSNEYPNYFPDSIYNESDQFKKIVEVANYDNKVLEEYDIDDNYIRETSDYIYDSIRDYHLDQRKKLANEELDLINSEYSKKPKKNTPIKYTDEQIAKILDRGSTKNIGFKEDIRRKLAITTANVIDKGYYIEKLARKTGNSRLDALYDNTLFSSSQAQEIIGNGRFEVNTPQKIGLKATLKTKKGVASAETKVGDSLYDIYEPIEESGKQKEFEEYMYHKLNVERMTLDKRYGEENKRVFAESIGADKSREFIKKIEAKNPEFKEWAKKVYEYESNDKYSDMATLVESGIMSKEQAEYLKEKYPSYVPIIRDIEHKQIDNMINGKKITVKTPVKKAKGGNQNMIPLKEAMAIKTLMVQRSANMNKLGLELMKTLNPEVTEQEMSADKVLEEMTKGKEMFTERNGLPTMSVFENGVKKTFEIPEEIYLALKPINADSPLNWTLLPTNKLSNLKRSVLTEYNVYFMLRNIVKDTQDVVLNSKHPVKTMAKFPEAMAQLVKKGYWYKEMEKQGIFNNSFFDGQKKFDPYMKKDGKVKTILKMPLTAIAKANNFVERIPRVAEYIASREAGYSVEEASLHSQRVTTNFKAGGQLTKFFNRNGATFLNAGVQGLQQQARNIQEANAEGLKGYLKLASKVAVVSSPVLVALLNNMLFGDDDDYEKTSDHEKNNYYFIAKYGDGNFIKIPRGRMAGVIQNVERQLIDLSKGKDKFDLDEAWDLFVNNVAPSNPLKSNIFSPFIDTKLFNKNDPGKTWYGEDLVPKSLQGDGTKAKDEYDEGTDKFSIWLGDKLNLSPIKINNLIDQNTGIIGDIILPLLTLETKTSTSNPLIAPLESAFTSDRVYDNKYPSMLYSMKDELEEKAKDKGLTQEDKAKQQYLNSISSEAYSYYNKIKSIQSSTTMTKNKKYEEVRKVREQMNAMIEDRLKGIDKITTSGNYSEVGEGKNKKYFYKNYKGNYTEVKEKELAKLNKTSMSLKDKDEYFKTKVELSQYMYNTKAKNKYTNAYKMILNSKTSQEGKAILYNNNSGFWSKDPTPLASVGLVDGFLKVESKGLKSDYKNGKIVTGSKQKKIIDAVNKLDGYSATEKAMIVKTYYNKYKNYDSQIIKYIDDKKMDSSKKKALLESLGFKVKGNKASSSSSSKITPYKSGSKKKGTSKKITSKKKSTKSVSVPRKKVTPIKISTSSKSANTFKVGTKKNNNKKVYQNALKLLLKK